MKTPKNTFEEFSMHIKHYVPKDFSLTKKQYTVDVETVGPMLHYALTFYMNTVVKDVVLVLKLGAILVDDVLCIGNLDTIYTEQDSETIPKHLYSKTPDVDLKSSIERFMEAEKISRKRDRDFEYQNHLFESEDEPFDESAYEYDAAYVKINLEVRPVIQKETIQQIEQKLNTNIPQFLKTFYTDVGNGYMEDNENITVFPADKIIGIVDFFQAQINEGTGYDIYTEDDFGSKLSAQETAYLKQLNSTYFVFVVSWGDYQQLELLLFDTSHHFYGLSYDIDEEQYLFATYLKDFSKTVRKHKEGSYLFCKFIDYEIMLLLGDDTAYEVKEELFRN